MKRMKKRMLALAAVLVLAVSMLTRCGGMTEEDAKEYVKATLDASYKADFDAYMKVTDSSKEEVQKLYDDNIENIVTSSGLQDMGITSELEEKYRELYKNMLSKAKYTVGDAKETDGGFEVVVKVEPFAFMEGVERELTEAIQNQHLAGDGSVPSEDEINQMLLNKMYELLAARAEDPQYGAEEELKVTVEEKDNVYSISEEDLTKIDSRLFAL